MNYLDWKEAFSFWQTGHDNYEFGVLEYPARMTIHVSHRIGAMVTAVVVLTYCVVLMKTRLAPFTESRHVAWDGAGLPDYAWY